MLTGDTVKMYKFSSYLPYEHYHIGTFLHIQINRKTL